MEILERISRVAQENSFKEKDYSLVKEFLDALEQGLIRCAHKHKEGWTLDERVKQGILLAFRLGQNEKLHVGPFSFIDKNNLWPRQFDLNSGVRVVPGGVSVRRGAFVGNKVTIMPPSYVNVGAYIDEGSLIDSNALVGSCAQVGRRVHISAGAQIGGVLEPVQALPVIIEDDVLIGGNCGIYEGCQIGQGAVLGAGVILTNSTKVFDVVHEKVISASENQVLQIPPQAVVVPGSRALAGDFAKAAGLSIYTPLIIKYRDQKTNQKTMLEDYLR